MYIAILFPLLIAAVFIVDLLILRRLIPWLKSKKLGQVILDIGPRWHKSKEGTPTMGGLAFLISSAVASVAALIVIMIFDSFRAALPFICTLPFAIFNGAIGIIDDSAKLRNHKNEGLTPPQKYLLQLIAAGIYLAMLHFICDVSTKLELPFTDISLDLGIWYYVIALLLITGIVNAVNLTDGVDGLASSVTFVVGIFFALAAFLASDNVNISLALLSAITIGLCASFLVYNFYPARVFMGDTGSLFLGAMVVGCAFVTGEPLIIVISGVIYITEAASDILQVGYFKLTHGKRLFKMAPIHHHFEKCGWSEIKIVTVFSLVTAVFSVLAWLGL